MKILNNYYIHNQLSLNHKIIKKYIDDYYYHHSIKQLILNSATDIKVLTRYGRIYASILTMSSFVNVKCHLSTSAVECGSHDFHFSSALWKLFIKIDECTRSLQSQEVLGDENSRIYKLN